MFTKINKNSQTVLKTNTVLINKLILTLIIFLFSTIIQATNVPEYVNLRQPNGYSFTARGEGDEFLQRFKTIDDYTIICSSTGWWYYASQGSDGKLYATSYRVGIEDDAAMQCLIEDINYSQSVIDAAQVQRTNFLNGLTVKSVTPKSVGIILVDFPDRIASRTDPNHPNDPLYISNNPQNSSWAKRYTMTHFQNLFFSENTYNTYSPDGTPVYGSFNDYYKKVSYGNVYIYGAILNTVDANGKPNWYRADSGITTYYRGELVNEVIAKANAAGFNVSSYNSICIIFAGQWGGSTGNQYLWPSQSGNNWIMGERNSAWDGDYGFGSVGVHVHEFGHYLGLGDYRPNQQPCSPEYGNGTGGYLLMGYGNYGADINHHSRPVLMSAYEKIKLNYLTPELISVNKNNSPLPNIEEYNSAWKIVLNTSNPEEYFLIENRQPIGFDGGIPGGGLLITHYASNGNWLQVGKNPIDIEEVGAISNTACGVTGNQYPLDFRCRPQSCWAQYNSQIEAGDFMNTINQVFGPWSAPNSYRLNFSTSSDIAIVYRSKGGSAIYVDVFKTGAIGAPPSRLLNLQVSHSTNNHPLLTWSGCPESDFAQYYIYKKSTYEGDFQRIGISSLPTYEDYTENYCPTGQQCESGHDVQYRVTAIDTQNKESAPSYPVVTHVLGGAPDKIVVNPPTEILPIEYSLSSNYPNPFNPNTIINYAVKEVGLVSLRVYDILGAEVKTLVNENKEAGEYAIEFNASTLPSGVYIYTMQVNGFTSSKKMLLMK